MPRMQSETSKLPFPLDLTVTVSINYFKLKAIPSIWFGFKYYFKAKNTAARLGLGFESEIVPGLTAIHFIIKVGELFPSQRRKFLAFGKFFGPKTVHIAV